MTFIEAAIDVLRQTGRPLHVRELTERSIKLNLLSHTGRAPEATMQTRLAQEVKKGDRTPLVQKGKDLFGLRRYDRPKAPSRAVAPVKAAKEVDEAEPEGKKRRRRRRGGGKVK